MSVSFIADLKNAEKGQGIAVTSQEQQLITTLGRHLTDPGVLSDDAFIGSDGRVYTTDMLIEGQHFDLGYFSPRQLGWKLGAVNLSDVAAMGAAPLYVLVSLGLPKHWDSKAQLNFVDGLYSGLSDLLKEFGGQIIGGDTVGAERVTLNLAAIGQLAPGHTPGRRHGAQPGDWIVSTGYSGLSAVGLQVLRAPEGYYAIDYPQSIQAHLQPVPQLAVGQYISAHYPRYALMDTSDGLADAALKIAAASCQHSGEDLQLCLNAERLPVHPELQHFACQSGQPPLGLVFYGGEDFQLLACIPAPEDEIEEKAIVAAGLIRIGTVKAGTRASHRAILENKAGMLLEVLSSDRSFQHF